MIGRLEHWRQVWRRALRGARRTLDDLLPWRAGRLALWLALIALVLSLLATVVWLAGRYEASQVQAELERDTQDAVSDLRSGLARDVQLLQGVQASAPAQAERREALLALLRDKREWLRVEQRDTQWRLLDAVDSPLREPIYTRTPRHETLNETMRSCLSARPCHGPAASSRSYLPRVSGLGMVGMDLGVPVRVGRRLISY
ncbi:MAG: PAS domain-containing sensor histidine kinase, partial [Limnohabitans sp.]